MKFRSNIVLLVFFLFLSSSSNKGFDFSKSSFAIQNPLDCNRRCVLEHEDPDTTSHESNWCELREVHKWPDGCEGYYVYNSCRNEWEMDGKNKRMHWTCCVHPESDPPDIDSRFSASIWRSSR